MKHARARSGDVEIVYSVEGEGTETVLLLMGLGGRAADWGTAFPRRLGERFRVVRVDNRGVGASPRAPGGYTLSDLSNDAVAVLDAVGAKTAHVIGISMGGMIAQHVALEHRERLGKLVLMSTHFGGHEVVPPHPDAMRLFDPQEFMTRERDPEAMMRFTLGVIAAPGFAERRPEAFKEMLANVNAQPTHGGAFMAQLQAILTDDRSESVRGIRVPTLVVHGAIDKLIPKVNGERLAERIPLARLEMLDGVGHMPMLEEPEKVADIVLGFLG